MIIESLRLNEMIVFTEFFLGVAIMYLVTHGLFVSFSNNNSFPLIQSSIVNLAILILLMSYFLLWNDNSNVLSNGIFSNAIVNDSLSIFAKIVIGFSSVFCLFLIKQYLITQKINSYEYIIILLFSILGLFLLCSSNDFMIAYLAIELQSLAFYMMAAFKKNSSYSVESGLKYFILGAFSSGLFLFGSSILYSVYGTINFTDLGHFYPNGEVVIFDTDIYFMINVGILFIFVSLFFKLALAPFHLWSPDIYENSPSSSSFFFAVVPKISIFIVLLRLSYYSFYEMAGLWQETVTLVAISSVIVSSLGGLEQRKFKSLLAYSSIGHMGYLLITLVSGSFEGFQVLLCYMLVYLGSSLCIWSVFMLTRLKKIDSKKQNKDLADFMLLKKSNLVLAVILTTALFSIAGLPPMIGFIVKLGIFLIAVEKTMFYIALFSMIFSVISTFYYLKIIKILYFEPLLVGKLYYPTTSNNVIVITVLFYSFLFLFINPSMLYLIAHKISLLFFL